MLASGGILLLSDADLQHSGAKAATCSHLASMSAASEKGSGSFPQNF